MKTTNIVAALFVALIVASCGTDYRMVTTLNRDGSAIREVYAKGDSAFMSGNISSNPYLFDIKSGWEIVRLDSAMKYNFFGKEERFNVKVSRSASSIDLFSKELSYDEDKKPFTAPEESLTKRFRWFYTNYTFTGIYKKLNYNTPVSIDKYLSKEEQNLWTRGNFSIYSVMNGIEMNDLLSEIEEKFLDWYYRNCFEISLNCIKKLSGEIIIETDKDNIYDLIVEQKPEGDISPERVCKALDSYYRTTHFTELYKKSENNIDQEFERATSIVNIINNTISYELIVPGRVLFSNSPVVDSNTLTWKVDGIRILFDDYTLTAEYRVANRWVFILSGLILITAIVSVALLSMGKITAEIN